MQKKFYEARKKIVFYEAIKRNVLYEAIKKMLQMTKKLACFHDFMISCERRKGQGKAPGGRAVSTGRFGID